MGLAPPGLHPYDRTEGEVAFSGVGVRITATAGGGSPGWSGELFKTLKKEEVRLKRYQTFEEAKADIVRFIEDVYKIKRLDSSLGYLPSAEIEVTEVGVLWPVSGNRG